MFDQYVAHQRMSLQEAASLALSGVSWCIYSIIVVLILALK